MVDNGLTLYAAIASLEVGGNVLGAGPDLLLEELCDGNLTVPATRAFTIHVADDVLRTPDVAVLLTDTTSGRHTAVARRVQDNGLIVTTRGIEGFS